MGPTFLSCLSCLIVLFGLLSLVLYWCCLVYTTSCHVSKTHISKDAESELYVELKPRLIVVFICYLHKRDDNNQNE